MVTGTQVQNRFFIQVREISRLDQTVDWDGLCMLTVARIDVLVYFSEYLCELFKVNASKVVLRQLLSHARNLEQSLSRSQLLEHGVQHFLLSIDNCLVVCVLNR